MSGAFPKSRRLRKRIDYLNVQRSGISKNCRYFVLVCKCASDDKSGGRIGITVSKKVGNAVIRNRIKRVVREFVRTKSSSLCEGPAVAWLPNNLDLVVIAKKKAATVKASLLWADLADGQRHLHKESERC